VFSREKARIYALADPAAVFGASDFIKRCVFGVLQVAPSDKQRFSISQSSGWFDYEVEGELWNRVAPPTLPTQADALKAAEGALSKLGQSLFRCESRLARTVARHFTAAAGGELRIESQLLPEGRIQVSVSDSGWRAA
jgi:hypothetical protein